VAAENSLDDTDVIEFQVLLRAEEFTGVPAEGKHIDAGGGIRTADAGDGGSSHEHDVVGTPGGAGAKGVFLQRGVKKDWLVGLGERVELADRRGAPVAGLRPGGCGPGRMGHN